MIIKLFALTFSLIISINSVFAEPPGWSIKFHSDTIGDKSNPPIITGWSIKKPTSLNGMNGGSGSIKINHSGWTAIDLPSNVTRLKVKIDSLEILPPKKYYKVLYRIDPRFSKPQIFIWEKDKNGEYISTLKNFANGALSNVNSDGKGAKNSDLTNMNQYVDSDHTISIRAGEVLNIKLSQPFNSSEVKTLPIMQTQDGDDLSLFYLSSAGINNNILYVTASGLCKYLNDPSISCKYDSYRYNNKNHELYGSLSLETNLLQKIKTLNPCNANQEGLIDDNICLYSNGRGVGFVVGENLIKPIYDQMTKNKNNDDYFLYYYSNIDTTLSFINSWQNDYTTSGMLTGSSILPSMVDWYINKTDLQSLSKSQDFQYNFIFSGNYYFDIEVGKGVSNNTTQLNKIDIKYKVDSLPIDGENLSGTINIEDGKNSLSMKINSSESIESTINYSYTYYNGIVNISDGINSLVQKIKTNLDEVTKLISNGLLNGALKKVSQILLTLYIIIYAIFFLIGSVEFTARELIFRCLKIIFIIQIFTPSSSDFLYKNLFQVFTKTIDYLIINATGAGHSINNVFGFIDPLINTYSHPSLYAILFIQLFQFSNGGFIVPIIILYSIYYYIMAIIMIICYYLVTYVSICVMTSLFPIFCCMILFERTRPMFEKYIGILFNYAIQPTILVIFILLVDQILSSQLLNCLMDCNWGIYSKLFLSLNLRHFGSGIDFGSIDLSELIGYIPYITYIPFFIPQYSGGINGIFANALLFSSLSLVIYQAIPYVDQIVQMLTSTQLPSMRGNKTRGDGATSLDQNIMRIVDNPIYSLKKVVSPLIGLGSYAYNNLPKVVSPLIGLGSYAYNNLPSLRDSSTNSSSLSAGLGDAKDNSQNLEDPGNKEKTLLKSSKIDSDKQTSSSQSGNKKESIKRKTIEPIIKDK